MQRIISKILFNEIPFITTAYNKIVNSIKTISLQDMPQYGLPPISTIGLGRK